MPDFATMTSDKLVDRLDEIERDMDADPVSGDLIEKTMRALYLRMKEVTVIHIELARRTASGWRPL